LGLVDCGADRKAADPAEEGEAREVERRYRTLVEQLPLVVYVDALDDGSSNIFTSDHIEPLLGYTVEEWRDNQDLFVRTLHPEDRDRVLAAHAHTHETHEPLSLEYRLLARDGRVVTIRDEGVIVLNEAGEPLYLQGYILDVTAERELQEQLRQQALFDPLTGLANRAFFHEQLEHAISIRKDGDEQTALVFVDLDEFKQINDQFGHSVGDQVLATLGDRLKKVIRAGDSVARLGGDEFAVLLTSVNEPAEAAVVAERLLDQIGTPIDVGERHLLISASIGISLGESSAELLKQADAAMYRAKANGDANYAFYDDNLDEAALNRFKRIAELREALDQKQFTLAYQPVVKLEPFEVVGLEALLRWQHPTKGTISPVQFIPLAEETGLIIPIGRWVLREACKQGAALQKAVGDGQRLMMSVNLSVKQLQSDTIVADVESALAESGLVHENLVLEITESVMMADTDLAVERLHALKALGVRLAMDDFGTGYSSLSYLSKFPVDILKMDRSFLQSGKADSGLAAAIVSLGETLNLQVVAEGIEMPEQLSSLLSLGCELGQGFLFAKAMPLPSVVEYLGSAVAEEPPVDDEIDPAERDAA
jgi:diguanylate cyclase (GGDEF)-like protein/PAS domain S-box-containing protein